MATSTSLGGAFFRTLSIRLFKKSQKKRFEIDDKQIPLKACLAVSQIEEYIQKHHLRKAYINLLSMRQEIQEEPGQRVVPHNKLPKKEDVTKLFENLKNKIVDIVRPSTLLASNKELLVQVVCIILEEEKRQKDPVWREAWRQAVLDGVRDVLKNVHLDSQEQKGSWLANHLGLLGKAVVENLECVKTELQDFYPPDFNVFETYVSCYHVAMGEHLKSLGDKIADLRDYHTLFDFILHPLPSDLTQKLSGLIIDEETCKNLHASFYHCLKEFFKITLDSLIRTEDLEVWREKKTPNKTDEGVFTSKIHTEIYQFISNNAESLKRIDDNLEKSAVRICLEELVRFPSRFEEEFSQNCHDLLTSDLLDSCLWVKYHITYINSFNLLKEHLQYYRKMCAAQVDQLEKELERCTQRFQESLLENFKTQIKPHLDALMTKEWLKIDTDFNEVALLVQMYAGHCQSMERPLAQAFVNDLHYYVAREYVSQLMKKKYSCKKMKKNEAAFKIKTQWNELNEQFQEMESSLVWFLPLGNILSDVISAESEKQIIPLLDPLLRSFPDISKKQFSAVLYFREKGLNLERNVFKHFQLLRQDVGETKNGCCFFTDIERL